MKSFENGEARKMEETFVKVNMILSMVMVRYIYTYVCHYIHSHLALAIEFNVCICRSLFIAL